MTGLVNFFLSFLLMTCMFTSMGSQPSFAQSLSQYGDNLTPPNALEILKESREPKLIMGHSFYVVPAPEDPEKAVKKILIKDSMNYFKAREQSKFTLAFKWIPESLADLDELLRDCPGGSSCDVFGCPPGYSCICSSFNDYECF